MLRFLSTSAFTIVLLSSFSAAQKPATDEQDDSNRVVFPADRDAIKKRDSLLEGIARVADGPARPPNIVLILADDLGYGDIGIHGSKAIPTPHIDGLGKDGVRFTNAYVTAASCSPSRAGLMTGRYQQRYGFEFNTSGAAITHRLYRGLDPSAVTMADVLQRAGYKTGMFGKWHLGTRQHLHPLRRGFDQFYGFLAGAHSFFPAKSEEPVHSTIMRATTPLIEKEYLTDAIARETVRFITDNRDQTFFAYVPFNAVHTPIEATDRYLRRFSGVSDPRQRAYNAMTSALDDAVGAILRALSENGLDDQTLVIFLNDNGGPIYTGVQSNGPLRLGKLFLFEGGIRVPMLVRWNGVFQPGTVYDQTVSSLDLFPTVAGAAGISVPDAISLDGVNLAPYVLGKKTGAPHEKLFWSNGPNRAMRVGNWKLVQSYKDVWLFDLESDRGEEQNLIKTHPEVADKMQRELDQWRSTMPQPAWPSKPNRRKIELDDGVYELNI